MVDLVIRNGTVIDGTGAPGRRADVAVDGDRIVAIGDVDATDAGRVIDAEGKVVCPGFVDLHTHYDVQVMWDPVVGPSPLHGVTTVIGGNCGFSIAPLGGPDDVDYVRRMMARVEGMPLETLEHGPPWDWQSFGEWLDRLEGRLGVNAAFHVGHSTMRRVVMGDGAHDKATPAQVDEMVRLTHESLDAGAIGFSSSLGEAHTDYDGKPVPSRMADLEEFVTLAAAVREHEGAGLEFIPAMGEIPAERIDLMTRMSLAANRPLNWNLLGSLSPTEVWEQQLTASDYARERGAEVVALALPDLLRMHSGDEVVVFPSLTPSLGTSPESWEVRRRVWNDDRVYLGGSDAGAHIDLMCHANYTTVVLGEMTRDRGLFTLEDAVRRMTDMPARLYGLRERGRVAEGWFADLVVFDPASVGSKPAEPRHDLPANGMRLYAEAIGIESVIVNGREIVNAAGEFTGDLPGMLLRSGRDTESVPVPGGA